MEAIQNLLKLIGESKINFEKVVYDYYEYFHCKVNSNFIKA